MYQCVTWFSNKEYKEIESYCKKNGLSFSHFLNRAALEKVREKKESDN